MSQIGTDEGNTTNPPKQKNPRNSRNSRISSLHTRRHIGLLAVAAPNKGLFRDVQCMLWALQQQLPAQGDETPLSVSVFPLQQLDLLERCLERTVATPCPSGVEHAVAPGTLFADWLSTLDALMAFETFLPRTFRMVQQCGVRLIYVPNTDWACLRGEMEPQGWIQEIKASACEVWAKTPKVAETLQAVGIQTRLVEWSIPDPVVEERQTRPIQGEERSIRFLFNGGMGGWRQRRGLDLALQAIALAYREVPHIQVRIKTIVPLHTILPHWKKLVDGVPVETIAGLESREQMQEHYQWADVLLYPSRWEGFGLSLLEALHAGLPCIATDGWPMNELVKDGHNGLLIRAEQKGHVRLAPHWECDIASFSEAMLRFVREPALLQQFTCPSPGALRARQQSFVEQVGQALVENLYQTKPEQTTIHLEKPVFSHSCEQVWSRLHRCLQWSGRSPGKVLLVGSDVSNFSAKLSHEGFMVRQSELLGEANATNISQRLPFPNDSFDLAVSFAAWQHISGSLIQKNSKELQRVLKPGAELLLCEHTHPYEWCVSDAEQKETHQADDFLDAFPGLHIVEEFVVGEELYTIFWGKLSLPEPIALTVEGMLGRLARATPFAYARFNDGEMIGIRSHGTVVSRGAQVVDETLSSHLAEALSYEQENYWKGLPCSICYPTHRQLAEQLIPSNDRYLTSATLLNNRNYRTFREEFPKAIAGRDVTWISGDDQKLQQLPFAVTEHIKLPAKNAWRAYADLQQRWQELPQGQLVMCSCGPLSRVLVRQWFERRPDCTFVDIGSVFDPETRGVQHRYHMGSLPPCPECN